MSSDSDIDYESADEDTNIKVDTDTKKDDTSLKTFLEGMNNDDTAIPAKSIETEISAPDSSAELTAVRSVNENIFDTNSNVNETIADLGACIEVKEASSEKLLEVNDVKDCVKIESFETGDAATEIDATKARPEKQRVQLRLEKKILQKSQQLSEDLSTEKSPSAVSTENTLKLNETKSSSWGFGSWGTSLLSTAASSVSTFTNQVSLGIGTVLETVESTLGAPAPEELAVTISKDSESSDIKVDKEAENENLIPEAKEENSSGTRSSMLPDVSSWTKVLENTGSKVIMGGLDTLELIGKKTIDMITEGDPGLRKKRSVFADGITLSQMLREAKAEADESKQDANSQGIDAIHYSQMFDEYQGLVHLEALEMLSKQSEAKIHRILMRVPRNSEVRKQSEEIKFICENLPMLDDPADVSENFEDFETVCKKYILELNLPFNVENLIKAQKRITDVVKSYESATTVTSSPEEIYQSAICSLAEFSAKSIETFHKLSELILVQPILDPNVELFATNLTGLTTVMCIEINSLSSRYHHCLDSIAEQSEDSDSQKTVTAIVTNLYVEASNSNKYIQDAFLLLVPVLQVAQLESSQ